MVSEDEDDNSGLCIVDYEEDCREVLTDEQWRNQDSVEGVGLAEDEGNQMPLIDLDSYIPEGANAPIPQASTSPTAQEVVGSPKSDWNELSEDSSKTRSLHQLDKKQSHWLLGGLLRLTSRSF
jgi:hypothetical protein